MPLLIDYIDKIAREKQRDVLFVLLGPPGLDGPDWEHMPIRRQLIEWLESEGIGWKPCGYVANENLICSYHGQIYIDVPFDRNNPGYRKVESWLENPDGTMRHPDATFCYLPLETAMKNAHHDEPGYWERWAESF